MLLKKLINNLPKDKKKIKIKGLSTNSKEVKKGYIFFAVKGNRNNGEKFIKEAMPDAIIDIQDLAGDGNHYSATVTSSLFAGKSEIEQHKMVYNSLKGRMGNELHALAIKTKE